VKAAASKDQINSFFLERWYPLLASTLVGLFVADVIIMNIRPSMLPTKAPPAKQVLPFMDQSPPRGAYNSITSKNIFNWDGNIPDPLTPKGSKELKPGLEQAPILSQLPLNLIGTIVHSNAEKSVASIEVKSKNQSISIRVKGEVENMAEILKIERNKVIFRNLNNNQLEYIEIQAKSKISFTGAAPVSRGGGDESVKTTGSNQFAIKHSEIVKQTSNLQALLNQARSAPHRNPETGEVDGFTILDYQPGSIFEKLGLQRMDILKNVNGQPVDSPAKAMELYNALKNSDKVSISIDRGGKTETLDYSITK
jgi:general secretion pathway protein C